MGINLAAFIGPIIAGWLGQKVDWHLGFACAGVGMSLGLVQYVLGRRHLQPAIERLARRPAPPAATAAAAPAAGFLGFTTIEWKSVWATAVFFLLSAIFCAASQQAV